jgi:cbb3-type cytochrome oxidase maturation protein
MIEPTMLYTFLIALCMGLGALAVFIWSVLEGQGEDIEDVKYRILYQELDDEERG